MPVPKIVITAALMAANMALTMTRKTEGPRLDDLKFTQGDYGAPLPLVWGTRRMQGNIFWAEDLFEVKRQRKTKGGKFNEYTYYGTWAVALAGHEIDAVTRIWFDTHLVYDITGAGPIMPFDFGDRSIVQQAAGVGTGGFSASDNIAIYPGSSTQTADPRMEATVEAEFGEGSCPAYRDTAYIVFKDVPLEKIGNRIPQVSVEFVTSGTTADIVENFTADVSTSRNMGFSRDYSRIQWATGTDFEVWDVASRSQIIQTTLPASINLSNGPAIYQNGTWLGLADSGGELWLFPPDGLGGEKIQDLSPDQDQVRVYTDGNGADHWISWHQGTSDFYVDGESFASADIFGVSISWGDAFTDGSSIWLVGRASGATETTVYFYRVIEVDPVGPRQFTVSGLQANGSTLQACSAIEFAGTFILRWGTALYIIDPETQAVTTTRTGIGFNGASVDRAFGNYVRGTDTIFLDNDAADTAYEISLADLTTIRTASSLGDCLYDPVNHAIWGKEGGGAVRVTHLDRTSGSTITLETIVGDVSEMVGISSYDFSDLDQAITGWSATRGPADNMVAPLLDAYDSDIRPHDFEIEGVKRHGVSAGTITTERLVGEPRYEAPIKQGAELPRSVTITFADVDADQQPNNTRADRPLDATGARGEATIDLGTLALETDEARQLGDRYFRRMWNERKEVKTAVTMQRASIEPGDVYTLELDGIEASYRLTSMTFSADDSIETEWKYDHPSLAILNGGTGATFDGRDPSAIMVPLPTKGFILDIPLLQDADNSTNPQLYTLAGPYATGTWPGAAFFEEVGGEYTDEFDSVPSSAAATWGYSTDTLSDANPNLWDRGNEVNVKIQYGELTGATEAALDADPTLNLCLLGDELLQFSTATFEVDGTYTLSGFKRGRRGTEWATGAHADRDVFLLLETADANDTGLSDVGTAMSFKTITAGRTDGFTTDFTFTGASLKPYAPSHLEAVKDGSGDWTFTWVRRTRVGGAWTGGSTIPLSEASEEYQITVGNGSSSDTKTVTSPTYTWTVAQQTTDTGAEVLAVDLEWSVAQVSDAVGAGFIATA